MLEEIGIFIRGELPDLGVLRPLTMPGVLSEGSFHDYLAESFRLRNIEYREHESWALARSFADFFDTGNFTTGTIAGIVRNPEKKFEYYAIPGTNDDKKPIDNIKVTLFPDSVVYYGDEHNNGFYMFDSLQPGEYKLIFEAEEFYKDSATVTVAANKSSFADKFLYYDESIPPVVVSHEPDIEPTDSVLANAAIKVTFSRFMDPSKTETAFTISPETDGVFKWENENRTMIFTPISPYEKATEYDVAISTDAVSKFGVQLTETYSFSFTTKNRNRLNIVKSYPENGGENLSPLLQVELQFDNSLNRSTIGENVLFSDSDGNEVKSDFRYFTDEGIGFISLSPDEPLAGNSEYSIFIRQGLLDSDGLPFEDSTRIEFKTSVETYVSGNILDDFETVEGWVAKGELSSGTDSNKTSFNRTYSKSISGKYSGRLAYYFTGEEGVAQFKNENGIDIGNGSTFGIWFFGDLSGNVLEFHFYDAQNSDAAVNAGNIDFSGWKLITIPTEEINLTGDIQFHSIVIKQTSGSAVNGVVYVDDIQTDIVLPVDEEKEKVALPKEFDLYPNYPNPFNPSTTIKFALPQAQKVKLEIFNLLGQRVITLVDNEDYQSGVFTRSWNGQDSFGNIVPSGIYLYRLEAGDFVKINKMVMLK